MQIRATHPYGFRSGEWATILRVVRPPVTRHECYMVRFPDGETDLWAVNDPSDPYEFRDVS